MRRTVPMLLIALGFLNLAACSRAAPHEGVYPVGVTTASFLDPDTDKPLTVEVWYPAPEAIVERTQFYARAFAGLAARDVPVRHSDKKYPLVVLSHAQRSGRFELAWLAEGLAADGYIVAAVDHPGSTQATYDTGDSFKLWLRAHHLSVAIDGMLRSEHFGKYVDARRIAVAGHSAGGSSALVLGGAQIDVNLYHANFPDNAFSQGGYDRRVRAVVALAPGTGRVFDKAGVAHLKRPTLIVSAQNDGNAPEPRNAQFYAHNIDGSIWHSIPNAGHYIFAPTCSLYGTFRSRAVCHDAWGVDRDQVHQQVIDWTRGFLREALKN